MMSLRRTSTTAAVVLAALCALSAARGDVLQSSPGGNVVQGDAQDLVFFADGRPLFVRLHIQVDGKGFRTLPTTGFIDKLFRSLDADQSGALDRDEAGSLADQLAGMRPSSAPPDWQRLDADGEGTVSGDEFRRALAGFLGPALRVDVAARRPTQAVGLLGMLDRDGNGRLSGSELAKGPATLRRYDIDANEVFGVDELLPPTVPGLDAVDPSASENRRDLPFMVYGPEEESRRRAAEALVKRYGTKQERDEAPLVLDGDLLRLDAETLAQADADADGRFDTGELTHLLGRVRPPARIQVRMAFRRFGFPRVSLAEGAAPEVSLVEQKSRRELDIAVGGLGVTLAAGARFVTAGDVLNFYRTQFLQADADKNQYLDEGEFGQLRMAGAGFAQVDGDNDGKLYRKEIDAFVKRATDAASTQVTMAVSQEGRSLFEILDANGDFRLTRREFQKGPSRLQNFDRNEDGAIAPSELSSRWRLSFRMAESPLLSSRDLIQAEDDGPTPVVRQNVTGPEWFQRMDQNRDGDLSPREFLGPRDLFARLDADGNGLLDAEEAETAVD